MTQTHLQHTWHCVGVWHGQEARPGCANARCHACAMQQGTVCAHCAQCHCISTTYRLLKLPLLRKRALANTVVRSPVHLGTAIGLFLST